MINPYKRNQRETVEATTLRNLEETTDFMVALNSDVGKLLFDDLIVELDKKFKLIYEEAANEQDKADFRALKKIGSRWNKLIAKHAQNSETYRAVLDIKNKKKLNKQ